MPCPLMITWSTNLLDQSKVPSADFTYTTDDLTAYFTDQSSDLDGSINSWLWDFGYAASSSLQNPTHTFPTSGDYPVTLIATDNDGFMDGITQRVFVEECGSAFEC